MTIGFDHLKNCIHCQAHIINICSSHIIASMGSKTKNNCSDPKSPADSNPMSPIDSNPDSPANSVPATCNDPDNGSDDGNSDDELGDGDIDPHCVSDEPTLAKRDITDGCSPKVKKWLKCIKSDPLRRAQVLVQVLRSSGQCREGFQRHIIDGNKRKWFHKKDEEGHRVTARVPQLQLLRDVKTRWDSTYLMLRCLRQLRPVSPLSSDIRDQLKRLA